MSDEVTGTLLFLITVILYFAALYLFRKAESLRDEAIALLSQREKPKIKEEPDAESD